VECILQCPITAILVDQKPLTMLGTVSNKVNNIGMSDLINVVYQFKKLIILLLTGSSLVKFLDCK
jgi:hypothetical protein